ncbi:hypothetical protein KCP73_18035 [Salmonella enterica subsp. enterica]|nr:hypothetical protein KCP73_18035 [Salmonella enterica subsp. enterica]
MAFDDFCGFTCAGSAGTLLKISESGGRISLPLPAQTGTNRRWRPRFWYLNWFTDAAAAMNTIGSRQGTCRPRARVFAAPLSRIDEFIRRWT